MQAWITQRDSGLRAHPYSDIICQLLGKSETIGTAKCLAEGLMGLRLDDITARLEQEIAAFEAPLDVIEVGAVVEVGDGIARGKDSGSVGHVRDPVHIERALSRNGKAVFLAQEG